MTNSHRTHPWYREYIVEILIFVGGVAAANAIFISRAFRQGTTVDPETAGQLGSFVGGYVGAIFALTGVLLLYRTLRNEQRTSKLQNFENKYFELIKMHRDNVAELELQRVSGRRIFVWLIRELRSAHDIIRRVALARNYTLTQREQLHVAYYCLFFGVGPNSSRMLKISLSNFDAAFVEAVDRELNNQETKERAREERGFPYVPFEGHQSRLGHYYRHLYQMIRYVDQQQLDIDKYEYVKTMRAQLSTHEQALLLVNSLTPIGQNWWLKDLMLPYRLVQNIPRNFFDSSTELDTTGLFGPGYFEWEEVDFEAAV